MPRWGWADGSFIRLATPVTPSAACLVGTAEISADWRDDYLASPDTARRHPLTNTWFPSSYSVSAPRCLESNRDRTAFCPAKSSPLANTLTGVPVWAVDAAVHCACRVGDYRGTKFYRDWFYQIPLFTSGRQWPVTSELLTHVDDYLSSTPAVVFY